MTYGLYAGISAADLGYEPDLPVCDCPKCDGKVYRRNNPPHGLICSECHEVYSDLADIATAEAYYLVQWDEAQPGSGDQRDEDESGYNATVAEGLTRWTR